LAKAKSATKRLVNHSLTALSGSEIHSDELSPMDLKSREHWVEYSRAKDVMQKHTDTELCPWHVVDANNKRKARLNCITHLLSTIPYKEVLRAAIVLSPR